MHNKKCKPSSSIVLAGLGYCFYWNKTSCWGTQRDLRQLCLLTISFCVLLSFLKLRHWLLIPRVEQT